MKIQLASDLHLEFFVQENLPAPEFDGNADVLVLAGDICLADHLTKTEASPYHKSKMFYLNFFRMCAERYSHVLYVAGNHEHYHGRFDKTMNVLKDTVGGLVTVLDNETVTIDDTKFIGGTLWTNANGHNPITEATVENKLNDYRIIQNNSCGVYRKLRMYDTMREFEKTLQFIDLSATPGEKCVVVTHHAPTPMSIGPKYKDEFHLNGGYASDLFNFIYDRPQIKLWMHGHVHHPFEYKVGETTVACNPGGYPGEGVAWNPNYVLEV